MTVSWRNYRLWLVVVLAVVLTRGAVFYSNINAELNVDADGDSMASIIVSAGDTLGSISRRLEADGYIPDAFDLRVYARLSGKADSIRAGEYALQPGLTVLDLLERLIRGDVIYHSITIPEGWTVWQALEAIREHPMVVPVLSDTSPTALQEVLGLDIHPEGQLFPDTYLFPRGTTDRELVLRAHTLLQNVLDEEWETRDIGLPFTTQLEALTLASIVEKETAVPEERGMIAGVFVRRLQQNMRLQTDPTVIYGLGDDFDGNLTRNHLRQPTPYNTYVIQGLPPTPIALVGREAIRASLHPEPGDALFFVARGDGTHVFSATLEEHNAAVRTWQLPASTTDSPVQTQTSE